jgi:hypothetical protein
MTAAEANDFITRAFTIEEAPMATEDTAKSQPTPHQRSGTSLSFDERAATYGPHIVGDRTTSQE